VNPLNARLIARLGLGDLLLGLVLAAIGLSQAVLVLSIAGTVFLLTGAGMLLWVLRTRGRATTGS
jgi:hypothetical protein